MEVAAYGNGGRSISETAERCLGRNSKFETAVEKV